MSKLLLFLAIFSRTPYFRVQKSEGITCFMMRLLHAKSRTLESFQGSKTPPYVILSHIWGDGEASFQHISGSETLFHLKGYQKSLAVANKPSLIDMSTFGLILAVSIRRVVQSFLKPLIQCFNGTTLTYVMSIPMQIR